MLRVDLHLHSHASNQAAGYFSRKLGVRECYVSPQDVHATLTARGMNLVTITDHDTLDGVLEIADRPNVFLSEEITTWFPEDQSKVHVLAWDITEQQHAEIQHVRENMYDLVDFLQANDICHALAHPLYDMSGRYTTAHIEKFLLLFDNMEAINGTRSKVAADLTIRMARECTPEKLERLANRWGFNRRRRDTIHFTAGTDDHSGFDIGTTWTECPGHTLEDLKRALEAGTTQPSGRYGSPIRLANTIISNGVHTLKERAGFAPDSLLWLFSSLRQPAADGTAMTPAEKVSEAPDFVQQVVSPMPRGTRMERENGAHSVIFDFFNNLVPTRISNLLANPDSMTPDAITRTIGEAVLAGLPMLTYLSTFWHRGIDKSHARDLGKKMGCHHNTSGKVAYLTDTFYDLNGVARTSQMLHELTNEQDLRVDFLLCDDTHESDRESRLTVFEPVFSLPVPNYPELRIHVPNLVRLIEHCEREDYEVIYSATPGAMGLCGLIAAKLLGVPYVTTFHTDFVDYAEKYTNDHLFVGHVLRVLRFFYNCADRVLAPSHHTAASLVNRGVDEHRIRVFLRGVDDDLFTPERRDSLFWARFDPTWDGEQIVLYAGRVAVEKGLDVFSETVERLEGNPNVRVAVVGDGPALDELRRRHGSRVIFTGYLTGEELATAYASADLFLFPSETETFGNVILEAQACGVPCLVAGKGASRENLTPTITGHIVEENDPAEYVAHIEKLLNDPMLLEQMRADARRYGTSRNRRKLLFEMIRLLSLDVIQPRRVEESDRMPVGV